MSNLRLLPGVACAVWVAVPCLSAADTYFVRRDNVIPVAFEDKLTVSENRPGDTFVVRVADTNQLPANTEFRGRIEKIHLARPGRSASMDLRFVEMRLPDGSRVPIDAAPIPLDNRYIVRYGDGRMVAKQDIRQQQADILGGAIGGFIVGSIFHRRIAGAMIGTMVGVAAAASESAKDGNTIVTPGQKVGALFNKDVTVDFDQGAQPPSRVDINRKLDRQMASPLQASWTRTVPDIRLRYDANELRFPDDALPYRIGDTVMVPLDPAARQLKLTVIRGSGRAITVNGPDREMRLMLDSRDAHLGSREFDLTRTVVQYRHVLYVPLDALVPLLKHDLFLNDKKVDSLY